MQVVNIPTMKGLIHHVGVRKRRPLFFWGPMGVGKSEGVRQCAAEHGATLVDIRLSQYDSVDLRGFPGVAPDNTTVWHMPSTLPFKGNPRFVEDDNLIFLFFDEANAASPAVSAVLYQITNDHRCGEHVLMDNVVIVLAGNRDKDRGVTNRQPAPMSNRLVHAELVADIKPFSAWGQQSGKIPPVMIAFLNFRPALLHTFDPERPTEKAFATPRTWEFAADFWTDNEMPQDVKLAAISGSVGEGPSIEFLAFTDIWGSLTPIKDVLANPDKVPVPDKLDVQYAMAVHVSGHMTKDTTDTLHRYLDRMSPEMVVLAWTLAINRADEVTETTAFVEKYAPKYRSLFQDS